MLLIVKEQSEIKSTVIGVYLGSFDPVHNAHIDIPLQIKKQYHLDKIIYVPTGISPVGKIFKASKSDIILGNISTYQLNTMYPMNLIHNYL